MSNFLKSTVGVAQGIGYVEMTFWEYVMGFLAIIGVISFILVVMRYNPEPNEDGPTKDGILKVIAILTAVFIFAFFYYKTFKNNKTIQGLTGAGSIFSLAEDM